MSIWLYKCNNTFGRSGQLDSGDWLDFFAICRRSRSGMSQWGGTYVTAQPAAQRLARNAEVGQVVLCWQSWTGPHEVEEHRAISGGLKHGLVGAAELIRIRPTKDEEGEHDFFFRPIVEFENAVDLLGELERRNLDEFRGPFNFPRKAATFIELSDAEARTYLDICGDVTGLRPLRPAVASKGERTAGQGFGGPEHNRAVEEAAVMRVRAKLVADGWTVRSVEADKVGYDLEARRGRELQHIEVKGTAGASPDFLLTENERVVAQRDKHWQVWVVTNALGARKKDHRLTAEQFLKQYRLTAITWRASAKHTHGSRR